MTAGALFDISPGDRPRRELAPGAVHVPSWLTSGQQQWIAGQFRDRGRPYQDVLLTSGDLFVFGGPTRFAFHGVTKIHPGTSPAGCGLTEGRINITMRVTGLE